VCQQPLASRGCACLGLETGADCRQAPGGSACHHSRAVRWRCCHGLCVCACVRARLCVCVCSLLARLHVWGELDHPTECAPARWGLPCAQGVKDMHACACSACVRLRRDLNVCAEGMHIPDGACRACMCVLLPPSSCSVCAPPFPSMLGYLRPPRLCACSSAQLQASGLLGFS